MTGPDEEFLKLLRSTFKVEAEEHLQAISDGLLAIEKASGADAQPAIERVFRAAHTLKGAARAVDFTAVERLCQFLEDIFTSWKSGQSAPTPEALDTLHQALDAVASALSSEGAGSEKNAIDLSSFERPLHLIQQSIAPAAPKETKSAHPPEPPVVTDKVRAPSDATVRVAVKKLEAQLIQAEEILTAKLAARQRSADFLELCARLGTFRKAWSAVERDVVELRQSSSQSQALRRLLDFFGVSLDALKGIESRATALATLAEHDRDMVGKLVDDLLDESKKLLLLPFATISASFQKVARDLARELQKEIDLTIRGEDVEIDKRILEEVKGPIVHLLRNSIDHGIETPEERTRLGKNSRASINIDVSQIDGNKVQLLVSDDGVGIDTTKVREWAIRHGAVETEELARLDEDGVRQLIFRSGVTTTPIVTQLSGRGLGLAIVQENAEKLGGEVTVESQPGVGTTFRIVVPAIRATFRGILVEAAGQVLVVPTTQVERVGRSSSDEIQTVQGRQTISYEGRAVPLVRLADALNLKSTTRKDLPPEGIPIMVLGSGDNRVAYSVDSIIDEQEVLVKPLRPPLARVRNVAGATVLGAGQIAPILNVADLLASARTSVRAPAAAEADVAVSGKPKSILVAEDSITSRLLLKSILESAGYIVKTAVDGLEAFTLLRAEQFDLVVSDVEMPRLSGFDLTARIRADRTLTNLPVILVTALATREDREHGIDAGANAYIVKGSFDQSDLLEAVRRLI